MALYVSDSISFHHQESSTVYTAIRICDTGYADSLLVGSGCNSLYMRHYTPDNGQKYCTKHVESYFKNKFEKLVRLVGFVIIIIRK